MFTTGWAVKRIKSVTDFKRVGDLKCEKSAAEKHTSAILKWNEIFGTFAVHTLDFGFLGALKICVICKLRDIEETNAYGSETKIY